MSDPFRQFTHPDAIDLSQCDREPIHLLGGIQPIGFLLVAGPDWVVRRASANAGQHLRLPPETPLLGAGLRGLLAREALHQIGGRLHLLRGAAAVERLFGIVLQPGGIAYDLALHSGEGGEMVLEAEPSDLDDALEAGTTVRGMIARLNQAEGLDGLCREAVRQIRALTGFGRVMLYRFAADGAGEVVAESLASFMPSFMGLRFPASDIPRQARRLYEKNLLRLIADTEAPPVPVLPLLDAHGQPLDLSLSVLRAVSPVHVEYLRNMGVRASMSISVLRRGRLWGLIACHHAEPLRVPFERRTAAELFAQVFALALESRERETEQARDAEAGRVHHRLMAALGALGPGSQSLADILETLAELIPCDGIGLWSRGSTALRGHAPGAEAFTGLAAFLNRAASGTLYATHCLGEAYPPAAGPEVAGLLAIPLSRVPRDYLVFFRRPMIHAVTWAGDPAKPAVPEGGRIGPRASFAAWREMVDGQSRPWDENDLALAERLRLTLLEVVLQLTDMAERERRAAQARQEVLIAELNHRVRNILGLIRGLVTQSQAQATTVEEFAAMVGGRVQALARAHDQITTDHGRPAPLKDLVQAEAAAYAGASADAAGWQERVQLCGPPVLLEPGAYTTLALVIHELMTNAAKYGALCGRHGQVRLRWSLAPDGALDLHWEEEGGPPVRPPRRQGFGTTIIERALPHDLKGEAELRYAPEGLRARFRLPPGHAYPGREAASAPAALAAAHPLPAPPPVTLSGRVLLVEDNLLIAMDAEEQLRRLGAEAVEVAASVQAALRSLEQLRPDIALLDVHLGRENSFPVADALRARGVPFLFATGYGEAAIFPERFRDVGVVSKPYTPADMQAALLRRLNSAP
ncbi:GAF domain-containing protein [Roseomonas sp. GC11]|uniref:HWE histidine kinase domain-containing protein n=1 Tax=Roseomonas sp. GC11 TaxID=2950546 RepID=UPI00210E3E44|nr:HWE histidine kinase domain-containing protein [Roseomonas sp. GC11]MCQ4161118.1 GAF domain-containing protein [Roseomonas sp. GC11]